MSDNKKAAQMFDSGWYCAESAVTVIAEAGGLDPVDPRSMASGLCSGMARTKKFCGALSGSIMGIGLYAGRKDKETDMGATYAMVSKLIELFERKYGTTNCFELTGCDFNTPEGQHRFREENVRKKCGRITGFAAGAALSILQREGFLPEDVPDKLAIAPCGLSCGKCLAYEGGDIQRLGQELKDRLGPNFAAYAERFTAMNPAFENYPAFAEMLDFFSQGSCQGCRKQGCLFKNCKVAPCVRDKGVEFCHECDEFPCDHHGFPEALASRWVKFNEMIRDEGLGAFQDFMKDKPRYP